MSSKLAIFNSLPIIDQFYLLASHMPQGRFWENCFNEDSGLGKLTKALSLEYYRLSLLTENIAYDYDISQTNDLILEWEESVGIPQDCFSRNRSLDQRRVSIEGLFSNFAGVQTDEDFVRIALLYGYDVEVYAGIDIIGFPMMFPIILIDTKKEVKHTIVINLTGSTGESEDFPFEFPVPFYGLGIKFLNCIFRLVAPSNVNVITTVAFTL